MSGESERPKIDVTLPHGKVFQFMPIPLNPRHVEWFDAGLVSIAVETRVLGAKEGGAASGGGSIHLFSGDRSREIVRFDCFDDEPHYHYLNHREQLNTVWCFDGAANGGMPVWVLGALRDNLPGLLRAAGEDALAREVELEGFDSSVLAGVGVAVATAQERCLEPADLMAEGIDWVQQWREKNPNVVFGAN